jgi:hypothetical protein
MACYKLLPRPVQIKEKIVTQVKERTKTVTVIKELPDGTKVTEIKQDKDTDINQVATKDIKPLSRDWSIQAGMALNREHHGQPIYHLGVSRRIILGASLGVYARTEGEYGAFVSYSF